ncbi:MAG: hypothetical protein PHD72_04525, partial [Patescibacteria group bacterium]|nr:hypothetical protein [Patescibacteria group bacterium]
RTNNEAVEISSLPVPEITTVAAAAANDILSFSGTAQPNEEVVVYIHSNEALVYKTVADSQGIWRVNHSQDTVELAPGEHTIYAVGMNSAAKIKSPPSPIGSFTIEKNFWVSVYKSFSLASSMITAVILLLVLSWLYWVRSKQKVVA